MLTPEEKRIVAETMGWEWYTLGGGIFYYRMIGEIEVPIEFDLNDAGLVRDWLVEDLISRCDKFFSFAHEIWDREDVTKTGRKARFFAWLFATENGEATNFFRAFAKWCEEEKK